MTDMKLTAKLAELETLGLRESTVRSLIAATLDEAGVTSMKHLADVSMEAFDELLNDCRMMAGQLDESPWIADMAVPGQIIPTNQGGTS